MELRIGVLTYDCFEPINFCSNLTAQKLYSQKKAMVRGAEANADISVFDMEVQ